MFVYNYSPLTGEYLSKEEADKSPLEVNVYLIPSHATVIAPPVTEGNQIACFADGKWVVKCDFRRVDLWSKETAKKLSGVICSSLDEINATEKKPTGDCVKWNAEHDDWEADEGAVYAAAKSKADDDYSSRLKCVNDALVILQDAVDLEMASTGEIADLIALKKYRVLLSRVLYQSGYPQVIEWPDYPMLSTSTAS